jgi:hypothetical protein
MRRRWRPSPSPGYSHCPANVCRRPVAASAGCRFGRVPSGVCASSVCITPAGFARCRLRCRNPGGDSAPGQILQELCTRTGRDGEGTGEPVAISAERRSCARRHLRGACSCVPPGVCASAVCITPAGFALCRLRRRNPGGDSASGQILQELCTRSQPGYAGGPGTRAARARGAGPSTRDDPSASAAEQGEPAQAGFARHGGTRGQVGRQ